ncbi:MAG: hypothetical protein ACQEWU_12740 [Bacillota bacterium]|uniref:Na+/H+ antiporter n=1 Tax=Virgibacillus salarius TaxID=447199 RepID=A0A941DWK6_9BACI|nr:MULTISPECIES: hypothetical protein [Bacillaceae]NAZ10834.1 hypothetical protein [Agaribacter marinus]MBR7798125.1 hypothetical protein [Virgibacillus salarius]MCC2251032.1 hypothetical protein [Virgibacillus sp. AGTR]MDY7042764.1 hypothetical protein [Virgibacillus sp. M23]QRZ17414.1 hypothetical protein JUJ52_16790 [Virgibacillus sp. AGTR]
MRILFLFAGMITAASLLYKWRYRIMNTLLAIGFLRKVVVSLSMNVPAVRSKIIPTMFQKNTSNS